jgi:RHS repeat-associated protein
MEVPVSARRLFLAVLVCMLASLSVVSVASAARYVDLVNATPGVTGYWRLAEISGTTAAAQKGPAGTYVNAPALGLPGLLQSDKPNFGTGFGGNTGRNVSVADGVHADFSTAYTLEAWVRIDTLVPGTTNYVICKEGAYALRLNGSADWEGVAVNGTGWQYVRSNPEDRPVAGATYHVVATFDGSYQRLYVNGQLIEREVATGPIVNTAQTLNVGACRNYDTWDGTIDEPAVYNAAMSPALVRDHYETGADGTPPAAPSGLRATAGDREVTIDWQGYAADDLLSYTVYRATSPGSAGWAVASPAVTTSEWTDTGLANGTVYEYWVVAKDSRGNLSGASARVSARPQASTRYRDAVLQSSGVQGYWRLGDASGSSATATVGDNGTIAGTPALGVAGLLLKDTNTSVDFDGLDDQVTIADSDRVDASGVVSFEAWVRPDARTIGNANIVAKPGAYVLALRSDGIPEARVYAGGTTNVAVGTAPLALGQPYHLVGTYDRSKIKLYVNGAFVSEVLLSGSLTQNANALQLGSHANSARFNGVIDEAALYDTTLSATEVKDRFDAGRPNSPPAAPAALVAGAGDGLVTLDWADNAETDLVGYDVYRKGAAGAATRLNKSPVSGSRYTDFTAPNDVTNWYQVKAVNRLGLASAASAGASGRPRPASSYRVAVATAGGSSLRGHWRLGETRGGIAVPQVGQEGDYHNNPLLGQTGLLRGETDRAPDFVAAEQDHMRVPPHSSLDVSTAFTLEAWIRQDSTPTDYRYILCKPGTYSLRVTPANDLQAQLVRADGTSASSTAPVKAAAGSTYHVAATYDGASLKIYVNGALSATSAVTGTVATTTNAFHVGTCGGTHWWDGVVDEPALYAIPLSAAQVKEHYDIGSDGTAPAPPTGLTAVPGDRQVVLDWAPNTESDLSGYEVLRGDAAGGPYSKVSTRLGSSAFTHIELENGKPGYYRVTAVDKAGNASAHSAEVKATPTSTPVLREPQTLHADGAELSWNLFDPATDGAFERYEIHRGTTAGFTPSSATLLATIPDRMITTYRDTSAGAAKTYTYKLTVNGRVSGEWTVTLPADGQSRKVLQPDASLGRATYIREGTCANRGADGALRVGTTASSRVRGLVAFDVSDIRSDATITSARVSLYAAEAPTVGLTMAAHRATTAWEEGDGRGTCDADGASWADSQAGDAWSVAGGDFAPSAEGSVTRAAGSALGWDDYAVTDLVRRWVSGEAPNFGVLIKATDETRAGGKLVSYHADGDATPASLRPRLIVDYADGSRTTAPQVRVTAPIGGDTVKGSSVKVTADAGDDRRVTKVDFFAGATAIGTDASAPYEATWNSNASANGGVTLKAVATDDVGNTTEATREVTVANSAAPTTSVEPPSTGYAAAVKADNPIGYYRLGEAAGATVMNDSSGNARDGSYVGAATTLGQIGLTRDGDTAAKVTQTASGGPRTTALSAPGVSSSSQLTVEAWIDFQGHAASGTYDHVIERGWSHDGYWGSGQGRWVLMTTDESACFAISKTSGQTGPCARIPRGRVHLVATYDGTTTRLYVDGTLLASTSMPGITLNTTTEIRIADIATQDQKIDDVSIFNQALGPADVQQHYDAAGVDAYVPTIQADGPSGYWRFGETTGTTVADSSGAARSGTLGGDVKLGQGTLLGRASGDTAALFGAPGGNENDGVVTVNGLGGLLGTNMTAEAWIDYEGPAGTDEWMNVMSRGWGSPGGWKISVYSCWDGCGEKGAGFFVNQGGTVRRAVTAVQPGRVHVAATYDGTKLRYYMNGSLIATEDVTALALTTSAPLLIGGSIDTGNHIAIDEAAVYDKVLSDERVRQHYISGRARAIDGTETIKATAADDGSVSEVQFFVDGDHFETDKTEPYEASLATLSGTDPTYDGPHELTTKVVDNHGNMTTSAAENVVVANSSPAARAIIAAEAVEPAVAWNPAPGAQQQSQSVDVAITNTGDRSLAAAQTDVRYRWVRPDGQTAATGDTALAASAAPNQTVTTAVTVPPPPLADGVERAKHQLQFDLVDRSSGAPVVLSTKGNPPNEQPSDVFRTDVSLGLERWHNYHGEELGGGLQHLVNVASGNSLVRWTPFESPGRGLSTVVDLTYNGLEDKSSSPAGNNWSLSISSLTRFGTPLNVHPNNGNTALPHDYIELVDGDGTTHRFEGKLAADNTPYYEEPAGVHLYLREYSATDPARKWAITRPDRTTFFFDREGWPTSVEDNNGNRITFTVVRVPPAEDPGGPRYRITKVTDAGAREFELTYWPKAEARSPHVRGKVKRITDHTGSALDFEYYDDGNVRKFIQRGSTGGGMPVPDREWIFTYTDSNGDAPALDATQRANPPLHVGNQSTRIYSVRDPRGHETEFKYYGTSHPDMRWRVTERENRANEKTAFTYDAAARRTTVTAPMSRVTKFDYDSKGQVTKITDPLDRATDVVWNADRHVSSVTAPKNPEEQDPRETTYKYDDNGYITEIVEKKVREIPGQTGLFDRTTTLEYEHPVLSTDTTKDVAGKWKVGRTVSHISQLTRLLTPKQQPWTFAYDENQACTGRGNLTSVTDPESSKTRFDYNCADGTVQQVTDPRNNTTTISYDANGLPTLIEEPQSEVARQTSADGEPTVEQQKRVTRMAYDADGLLQWLQDPNHALEPVSPAGCDGPDDARDYRTCFEYDAFQRLRRHSTPKSTVHERDDLLWSSVEFDQNDNILKSFAPAEGQGPVTSASVTASAYDVMDRVVEAVGPDDESSDGIAPRTTVRYDEAGRPDRVTLPKGNATAAIDTDFARFTEYDTLDRPKSITRYADGETFRTRYCYDAAGDLRSVTRPLGDRTDFTCSPYGNGTHTWRMDYFRDHRMRRTEDPTGKTTSRDYDANGNLAKAVDSQGTPTTYEYNGRDQVKKIVEKFDTSRHLTSVLEYDEAGNVVRSASPRATSKNPGLTTYAGKDYVTSYTYDALNRLTKVTLPDEPGGLDPTYVHRRYDANGNSTLSTLPTLADKLTAVEENDVTKVGFFDPGWVRTKDEGPLPVVLFDYRPEGWQNERTAVGRGDRTLTTRWRYFNDGRVAELDGRDGQTNTYRYDAHDKLVHARAVIGTHDSSEPDKTIVVKYDGLDRLKDTREKRGTNTPWRVDTFAYNRNDEIVERVDNATASSETALPVGGRRNTFGYRTNGWLDVHHDFGTDTGAADDRRVDVDYTDTGWQKKRIVSRWNGTSFTPRQTTERTFALNRRPLTLKTYTGSDPNSAAALREKHDVEYFDADGQYFNGHRLKDTFVRSGPPGSGVKCLPGGASCVKEYGYDARDKVTSETLRLPDGTNTKRGYTLSPTGNVVEEKLDDVVQIKQTFEGNQLVEVRDGSDALKAWYRYDAFGNNDCVTTGTRSDAVCKSWRAPDPSSDLLKRYRYDALNRLRLSHDYDAGKLVARSEQTYDALNRPVRRVEAHERPAHGTPLREKVTTFAYRGLSSDVTTETRIWTNPPNTTDPAWKRVTRHFSYDAGGHRVAMTSQRDGSPQREFTYGQDIQGSVSLVLDDQGGARASYGYTAYGKIEAQLTAERDIDDPALKPENDDPTNPYGFMGKRRDTGSGTLDMGARRYSPDTGRFLQADMYEDALGDLALSHDPITQNRYSLVGGNPVSFVEVDGHLYEGGGGIGGPRNSDGSPDSDNNPTTTGRTQNLSMDLQNAVAENRLGSLRQTPFASRPTNPEHEALPPDDPNVGERILDGANDGLKAVAGAIGAVTGIEAKDPDWDCLKPNHGCQVVTLFNNDLAAGGRWAASWLLGGLAGKALTSGFHALRPVAASVFARSATSATGSSTTRRGMSALAASCVGARSFSASTRVLMASGKTKRIADIRRGDRVVAHDPETGRRGIRVVGRTWAHGDTVVDLRLATGTVTTTEDHRFWNATDRAWEEAQDLDAGDRVLASSGTLVAVGGLDSNSVRPAAAYNLTVEDLHTYFVAAGTEFVLVHNEGGRLGCDEWAAQFMKEHGGELVRIRPQPGGPRLLGPVQGTDELWYYHVAVKKGDLVYDARNPGGVTPEAYKQQFLHNDVIDFGGL